MGDLLKFPPEVFARLAPDIYFQRHLEKGLRPTGRDFLTKRQIDIQTDQGEHLSGSIGSAVLRAGGATIICGVNLGTTRFETEGGIYPNVEIHRGGMNGNPTGEEQVLTERLHRLLGAAQIDKSYFTINEELTLVLTAQIVVLSRTGPLLDLCWQCLINAIEACKVPKFTIDDKMELVPTGETFQIEMPGQLTRSLNTYGLVQNHILADIDGPVEEECINDLITIGKNEFGLSSFSLCSVEGVSLDQVLNVLNVNSK